MKFSIITICYNPGKDLKTAVDSVLSQHGVDVEYIIIDGGSTDGTVEYIQSLNSQVSKFVSEPDNGLYDALNKGIALATGDVVGLVHADDLLASNDVLSDIAAEFQSGDTDAVYGDLLYVAKDNPDKTVRYWQSGQYHPDRLKNGWMPPHPTLYVKRQIYQQARLENGQYFDTSLKIAADYDFMMRLFKKMQISVSYLQLVLVMMRTGGVSNRSIKHLIRKSYEDYLAMKRNNIGGIPTLLAKNFRKLPQFVKRAGARPPIE